MWIAMQFSRPADVTKSTFKIYLNLLLGYRFATNYYLLKLKSSTRSQGNWNKNDFYDIFMKSNLWPSLARSFQRNIISYVLKKKKNVTSSGSNSSSVSDRDNRFYRKFSVCALHSICWCFFFINAPDEIIRRQKIDKRSEFYARNCLLHLFAQRAHCYGCDCDNVLLIVATVVSFNSLFLLLLLVAISFALCHRMHTDTAIVETSFTLTIIIIIFSFRHRSWFFAASRTTSTFYWLFRL